MVMIPNFKELNDLLGSSAGRRAAVTNREASPHTVSIDPGPRNMSQVSGKSPGNGGPEGAPGVVRNIVLVEGPAHEVHEAVAELQLEFPAATLEPTEQTARHRELFRKETHALPETAPAAAITVALGFETEPPDASVSVPDALRRVNPVVERWRNTLMIGHLYFDTRRVPSAAAIIRCEGPVAESATPGVDVSRSGQMPLYSRIELHFCDDYNAFFRGRLEEIAEVEAPYPYRQEWDEEYSPLGLEFSSEDPARQGWGLADGSDSAPPGSDFLVENGYLPPDEVSVAVPTNWIDALTLVVHGEDGGVYASFDGEGRMLVSGFGLRAAGLIDANLTPTVALSGADRRRYRLGSPPTERTAMIAFLQLYAQNLDHLITQYVGQNGEDELASRLRRHGAGARRWLLENAD